jgi:hypothetical protein
LGYQTGRVIKVTGFGAGALVDDYTSDFLNGSTARYAQLWQFGHGEILPLVVKSVVGHFTKVQRLHQSADLRFAV